MSCARALELFIVNASLWFLCCREKSWCTKFRWRRDVCAAILYSRDFGTYKLEDYTADGESYPDILT